MLNGPGGDDGRGLELSAPGVETSSPSGRGRLRPDRGAEPRLADAGWSRSGELKRRQGEFQEKNPINLPHGGG